MTVHSKVRIYVDTKRCGKEWIQRFNITKVLVMGHFLCTTRMVCTLSSLLVCGCAGRFGQVTDV